MSDPKSLPIKLDVFNYIADNVLLRRSIARMLRIKEDVLGVENISPDEYFKVAVFWFLQNRASFSSAVLELVFEKGNKALSEAGKDIWNFLASDKKTDRAIAGYQFVIVDRQYISWTGTTKFYDINTGEASTRIITPIESTSFNLVEVFRRFILELSTAEF